MARLPLKVGVKHDYGGARKLAALPPRLDRAMADATPVATRIVGNAVRGLVVSRTSMNAGVADAITEEESSAGGSSAGGKVSFKPPPPGGWEIRPKNKKALAWPGGRHPVKSVQHPGSRPYALIGRGAKGSGALVERAYADEVRKVLG